MRNPTLGSLGNYSGRHPTEDQSMASRAKRPAKRKASAKKPARRKVVTKKIAKKQGSAIRAAKKTARSMAKSARQKTTAVKKASKGMVRRAIEAIADVAAPLLPGASERPKSE